MYLEDVDFCDRLRGMGKRVDYITNFRAVHLKGGGSEVISLRSLLSTIDSMHCFVRMRWGNWIARITLATFGPLFLLRAIVLTLRFWRRDLALKEGYVFLIGAWRAILIGFGRNFQWGPPC